MRKLLEGTKDLTGIEEDPQALEEAAVFLYQLFAPSPDMSRSHGEAIKAQFGPYPAKVAVNVAGIVKRIASSQIPDDGCPPEQTCEKENPSSDEFGLNVKFRYSTNLISELPLNNDPSLSDDEAPIAEDHDQLITKGLIKSMKKSHDSNKKNSHVTSHVTKSYVKKYSRSWLEQACQSCRMQGLSWQQLYEKLFDLLLSEVETTVIENEVGLIMLFVARYL